MSDSKNLGTPSGRIIAPELAYGPQCAFNMATDSYPRTDVDYRSYKFLGRLAALEAVDGHAARAWARDKFGPKAGVYRTPRYWIAYEVG